MHVEPIMDGMETNPALNQTLAPGEAVALVSFRVEMFDTDLLINICIPYISIESVLDRLVIKSWVTTSDDEQEEEYQETISKN